MEAVILNREIEKKIGISLFKIYLNKIKNNSKVSCKRSRMTTSIRIEAQKNYVGTKKIIN